MELEIKDITDTAMSASYLVLHLAIDSEVPAKNETHNKRESIFSL